jgi:hypothetical protein
MASIHSVLKRLTEAGEIIRDEIGGETVYLWLTPLRRALLKEAEDCRKYRREAFVGIRSVAPAPPDLPFLETKSDSQPLAPPLSQESKGENE